MTYQIIIGLCLYMIGLIIGTGIGRASRYIDLIEPEQE